MGQGRVFLKIFIYEIIYDTKHKIKKYRKPNKMEIIDDSKKIPRQQYQERIHAVN